MGMGTGLAGGVRGVDRALARWEGSTTQSILRAGLYLGIGLAVLPYGAVLEHHFLLASLVTGIVLLGVCLLVPLREQTRMIVRASLYPLVLAIAFILAQALFLHGHPFAHAIWSSVAFVGIEGGAVSVDPAATRRALLSFMLPFAIFFAAVALHDSDEQALRLWRRLAFLGAAVALFGLMQHLFMPDRLLFWEQGASRGVTGVFVNPNTAATFFGLALLLLVGVAVDAYRRISARGLRAWLLNPVLAASDRYPRFLAILLCVLVTSLALVLTLSRGGVIASLAALAPVLLWVGLRHGLREAPTWKRALFSIGFAGFALVAMSQMAARTAARIERLGIEDGRWCITEATIRAIADSPPWGTGLGTFEKVFPLYRTPDCHFHNTIDIAHNVYLEAYLGMGLMAPVLAIIILWILFRALRQGLQRRRYKFAGVIGSALVFLVLLHSLFDFSLQIPGVAVYLAAALAAAVSLSLGRSQQRRAPHLAVHHG